MSQLPTESRVARAGVLSETLAALTACPPVVTDTAKPGKLCTIPIPVARCHTYNWNQDSFGEPLVGALAVPAPVPQSGQGASCSRICAPASPRAPPAEQSRAKR